MHGPSAGWDRTSDGASPLSKPGEVQVQATPANWPNNHESIGAKGWAFLLSTVTPEDADKVNTQLHTWPVFGSRICCYFTVIAFILQVKAGLNKIM